METKPLLPGRGRLLVFVVGLGLLYLLGSALVAATTLGTAFCILGFLGLVTVVWLGLLLVRTGQYIATATGEAYERLELLGQALREVAPGKAIESPANLPPQLGVLDLPVAYSELRYLASQENESPMDLPAELKREALAAARETKDERAQAQALSGLAEHLPEDLKREALAAAREIRGESARARALNELVEHLPEELKRRS